MEMEKQPHGRGKRGLSILIGFIDNDSRSSLKPNLNIRKLFVPKYKHYFRFFR